MEKVNMTILEYLLEETGSDAIEILPPSINLDDRIIGIETVDFPGGGMDWYVTDVLHLEDGREIGFTSTPHLGGYNSVTNKFDISQESPLMIGGF